MIYGIGIDIVKVDRIKKWIQDGNMIRRFFNPAEMNACASLQASAEHYAARFAAKEAFGKALGTGLAEFRLQDVFVKNDELYILGAAENLVEVLDTKEDVITDKLFLNTNIFLNDHSLKN